VAKRNRQQAAPRPGRTRMPGATARPGRASQRSGPYRRACSAASATTDAGSTREKNTIKPPQRIPPGRCTPRHALLLHRAAAVDCAVRIHGVRKKGARKEKEEKREQERKRKKGGRRQEKKKRKRCRDVTACGASHVRRSRQRKSRGRGGWGVRVGALPLGSLEGAVEGRVPSLKFFWVRPRGRQREVTLPPRRRRRLPDPPAGRHRQTRGHVRQNRPRPPP